MLHSPILKTKMVVISNKFSYPFSSISPLVTFPIDSMREASSSATLSSSSSSSKLNAPPVVPVAPPPFSMPYEQGAASNTLTEPVWETVKRDLSLIGSNLKLVVIPNPSREDPGKALRDWDLWGPFLFVLLLGLALSWSASIRKSEVFAVAFALMAAGSTILTLNILLLGGRINFFQSISLLGYCLFPMVMGSLICMFNRFFTFKLIVVGLTLAWSSWAAYPFMSSAVNPNRRALALYPLLLMYISVAFLIIAID